jgi:hypothetical protein
MHTNGVYDTIAGSNSNSHAATHSRADENSYSWTFPSTYDRNPYALPNRISISRAHHSTDKESDGRTECRANCFP